MRISTPCHAPHIDPNRSKILRVSCQINQIVGHPPSEASGFATNKLTRAWAFWAQLGAFSGHSDQKSVTRLADYFLALGFAGKCVSLRPKVAILGHRHQMKRQCDVISPKLRLQPSLLLRLVSSVCCLVLHRLS